MEKKNSARVFRNTYYTYIRFPFQKWKNELLFHDFLGNTHRVNNLSPGQL